MTIPMIGPFSGKGMIAVLAWEKSIGSEQIDNL
jgi:hypothetical protein